MKHIASQVRGALEDSLLTFKWFERALAVFLISIPIILYCADHPAWEPKHFRSSISNYVYMCNSYVFGLLLGTAALLFIFNGVIYLRSENLEGVNADTSGKWYNLVLGICLLGVVVFPHLQHPVIHYIFAGAFFLGNAATTIIFHTRTWPKSNTCIGILTVAGLGFYFLDQYVFHWFPGYTLFWAEWLSVAVVGVHFFLDSLD